MTPKEFLWCGEGDLNPQAIRRIRNLLILHSAQPATKAKKAPPGHNLGTRPMLVLGVGPVLAERMVAARGPAVSANPQEAAADTLAAHHRSGNQHLRLMLEPLRVVLL